MKRIVLFPVLLIASGAVGIDDSPLSRVADQLSKLAEDMEPVASVEQTDRAVTLSFNTRKFMVHNTDKLGRHSEKAHETVGPRYDGLIVQVAVQDDRYAGAAKIPQNMRKPYWATYVNAYPIAKGKQHLHVTISYGTRTDREIIEKIKKILESMISDDLKSNVEEPEAHNNAIDSDKQ